MLSSNFDNCSNSYNMDKCQDFMNYVFMTSLYISYLMRIELEFLHLIQVRYLVLCGHSSQINTYLQVMPIWHGLKLRMDPKNTCELHNEIGPCPHNSLIELLINENSIIFLIA